MPLRFPEHSEFLKDKMGRFRTQSLFHEFASQSDIKPVWTLRDQHPVLPSLKKMYLEIADPTEYQFAMEAFDSWQHWLKIKASKAILPWIEDWPIELEVKLRSQGIQEMVNQKEKNFNAAKFLAKGEWHSEKSKRGRPSKEEVERERKIAAKLDEEIGFDLERIGLQVIVGDK